MEPIDPCAPEVVPLVRAIHAAAVGAADWSDVLEQLRRHLRARVVTLGHHRFDTGSDSALLESPCNAGFGRDLAAYAARNPWFLSSDDYVPGRVMTGDELLSNHELLRTDFYRGVLRPRGLLHLLCGVVDRRPRGVYLLSAYRAEDDAAFAGDTKAQLGVLLDHLSLSLEAQWRQQEAVELAHALLRLSDHDANPAILVTAEGEPIHCNPAAGQLLEQRAGLQLDGARLVAASAVDRRLLAETIARVAQGESPGGSAPAVLTLACLPPTPPIVVVIRAVGRVFSRDALTTHGLAMLAVRGSQAVHDAATCAFARQYELTAAQAKVSALIFAGQPLPSIARSLKLSENTVRSHLKQIFQKTDTHGQMELVHLHARVCPTLP